MACFLTPAAAALIVSSLRKKSNPGYHLEWLLLMLGGGVIMLVVDHVMAGEIVMSPPFLTALGSKAGLAGLLEEMLTTGGLMTAAIVAVWGIMVALARQPRRVSATDR